MKANIKSSTILVKRYGRSRLYEPAGQRYVSVDQLRAWRAANIPFSVVDAESGKDVTRVLLA